MKKPALVLKITVKLKMVIEVGFGIIGCAGIARKIARAISQAPNATLVAIASRSLSKAEALKSEIDLEASVRVYGDYESLLDDPSVDAVYIPLPTSLRVKWAVAVAEKKKHVLLEKPTAMNVAELDSIIQACEVNGVEFMDGTMFVHHPRMDKMKEIISDPWQFGQLKMVIVSVGTMDRGPRPMDRTGPDGPGGRTGGRTSGRTGLTVQAHEAQ
ncbi:hypothetical protein ZOSMA_378G00020 [Zostera marina]|uniref:Gfo/Idh/MocA-like oxidoreductase N-terminal domain-containing protein n=1 Tax=Zostera marina TaxID=29655 RepID=A0A0K9P5K1_ZOSMR|nr:hypothetical protein ZOSMA_378G00020 [Zostera marina]